MAEGGSFVTGVNNGLYTLPKSKTPLISQTVRFKDKDIYSKFESKFFQQYGEKNFKKKGKHGQNGNVYGFRYKSKSVTITLYESTSTLRIQDEGCQQWLNGEFREFENQLCEEMKQPKYQGIQLQQQLATPQPIHKKISGQRSPQPNFRQQQSPVTGSEPLVSLKEFQTQFAVPKEIHPRRTILLYKYSSNATTKFKDIPENTWQRIDNDPQKKKRDYIGEHAESIMIKKLTKIQEHLKEQPDYKRGSYKGIHAIDVILSYSPCNEDPHCCSTKLCEFKTRLEEDIRSAEDSSNSTTVETTDDASSLTQEMTNLNLGEEENKGAKIEINIQFSNFYQDFVPENTEGLKKLLQNGIALDILTGNKWNDFYKAIGFELPAGREEREKEDEAKFEELSKQ